MSESINQSSKNKKQLLATFALFAYNQEKYIKEAIEGALAQTYSPLEIILSDDCSTDGTFEIMKDIAGTYCGPHTILLNRNKNNLGVAGHVNRVMELAQGELVVAAAGDDISVPNRTEKLVCIWNNSHRKVHSIFSSCLEFDEQNEKYKMCADIELCNDIEVFISLVRKNKLSLLGATQAWSRDVFEIFGPLEPRLNAEDAIIPFRSLLLGGIAFTEDPLVKYRITATQERGLDYINNFAQVDLHYRKMLAITSSEILREFDSFVKMNSCVGWDPSIVRDLLSQGNDRCNFLVDVIKQNGFKHLLHSLAIARKIDLSLGKIFSEHVKYRFSFLYRMYWKLRYYGNVKVKNH